MTRKARPIEIWTEGEIRILRALALTEPSARDIARALERPESTVRHKLADLQITPVYRLSHLTRSAIERLHREGQPVRRITIRTGIPIPIVQAHLAKAGVGKDGGSSPQDVGKDGPA